MYVSKMKMTETTEITVLEYGWVNSKTKMTEKGLNEEMYNLSHILLYKCLLVRFLLNLSIDLTI